MTTDTVMRDDERGLTTAEMAYWVGQAAETARRYDARRSAVLGEVAARATERGPRVEVIVARASPSGRMAVTLPVRMELLGPGAREAIEAGLLSLLNADDASRLFVRTGRPLGAARRAAYDAAEAQYRGLGHMYGLDAGWDDAAPEVERVHHHAAWVPERETLEEHLTAALAHYAGRIVSAGLGVSLRA